MAFKIQIDRGASISGKIVATVTALDGSAILDQDNKPVRIGGQIAHLLPDTPTLNDVLRLLTEQTRKAVQTASQRRAEVQANTRRREGFVQHLPADFTVPDVPAAPVITSPSDRASIASPVIVEGTVDTNVVSVTVNGENAALARGAFSKTFGIVPAGAFQIIVIAVNSIGESSETQIGVTVT